MRTDKTEESKLLIVRGMQEVQRSAYRILEEMRLWFVSNTSNTDKRSSRRCWVHEFDGHDINQCGKFRSLNSAERLEVSKKKGDCFRCLSERHLSRNCKSDGRCDRMTRATFAACDITLYFMDHLSTFRLILGTVPAIGLC